MAIIIDGKKISADFKGELKSKVAKLKEEKGLVPGLAVVIVGEDAASKVYVRNKHKACEATGIYSAVYEMPENTTENQLLELIDVLKDDDRIHGILVQLPLPKHIDEERIIHAIPPEKDVDAFHPYNVGRIMIGNQLFVPCTPAGVMELLSRYNIEIEGKHCVIIGRSNIVGKPQAMLMLQKNATVTICHSRTHNLADITCTADIIVAAVGKANFVSGDMVKQGAVVVDVGINRMDDGKLCGDVNYAQVEPKASYITPVPGGVGPMTIAMLLKNTITAAENSLK